MTEKGEGHFEFLSGELGFERCAFGPAVRRSVLGSVGGRGGVQSGGGEVEVGEGNRAGKRGERTRHLREILMPFMCEAMAVRCACGGREESESSRDEFRAERDGERAGQAADGGGRRREGLRGSGKRAVQGRASGRGGRFRAVWASEYGEARTGDKGEARRGGGAVERKPNPISDHLTLVPIQRLLQLPTRRSIQL